MSLIPFDTPENIRKPRFSDVSGGIKRDQLHEMG